MTATKSILITGGTGFLGSALVATLLRQNMAVTVFSRSADKVAGQFGDRVKVVTRIADLPDAGSYHAVVNLAGAGIFDRRWTPAYKQLIRDSRIELTRQLVGWMASSVRQPEVLISGSAIGVYGDQGDDVLDEDSLLYPDFAQKLCADWEAAALEAEKVGVRVCIVRTGLVVGQGGGLLQRMLPAFRLGLGGALGSGRQWMSWIDRQDWLSIVEAMIANAEMRGAYNATAPNPVTNRDFSATLAAILHRPMLLPLPAAVLKCLLGEMADLVLGSQRVIPRRLLGQDFVFQYPQLDGALRHILTQSR